MQWLCADITGTSGSGRGPSVSLTALKLSLGPVALGKMKDGDLNPSAMPPRRSIPARPAMLFIPEQLPIRWSPITIDDDFGLLSKRPAVAFCASMTATTCAWGSFAVKMLQSLLWAGFRV